MLWWSTVSYGTTVLSAREKGGEDTFLSVRKRQKKWEKKTLGGRREKQGIRALSLYHAKQLPKRRGELCLKGANARSTSTCRNQTAFFCAYIQWHLKIVP